MSQFDSIEGRFRFYTSDLWKRLDFFE